MRALTKFIARLKTKLSFIDRLTILAFIFAPPYLYAMVFYPYFKSGCDWSYLQAVWQNWQTVNAGILAFLASIVAISLAQLNAKNRDAQNLAASLAFLDSALHELSSFCRVCAKEYQPVLKLGIPPRPMPYGNVSEIFSLPDLPIPTAHREIFRECIKYSHKSIQIGLSSILSDLQILRAKMDINREYDSRSLVQAKRIAYDELASLVLMQAKIFALYPVARGKEETLLIPIDPIFISQAMHKLYTPVTVQAMKDCVIICTKKDELFSIFEFPI